jgi:hypothetical protein
MPEKLESGYFRDLALFFDFERAPDFRALALTFVTTRRFSLRAFLGRAELTELLTIAATVPNVDPMVRATSISGPSLFLLDALFISPLRFESFTIPKRVSLRRTRAGRRNSHPLRCPSHDLQFFRRAGRTVALVK